MPAATRTSLFLILSAALNLTSCSLLFETNLFGLIEQPAVPHDKAALQQKLATETNILSVLKDDPAERADLLESLALDVTALEDARLFVEILVKGTYAVDLARNVLTDVIPNLGLVAGGLSGNPDLQALVGDLFGDLDPAQVLDTVTAFNDLTVTTALDTLAAAGELTSWADAAVLSAVVSLMVDATDAASADNPAVVGELIATIQTAPDQVDAFIADNLDTVTMDQLPQLTFAFDGDPATQVPARYAYLDTLAALFSVGM